MGSVETIVMIPLGSVDIVGAGLIDSITNTINGVAKAVGELELS